ncbi:MAG: DUF402 domain-containing protein [Lachnospiraceae bacterium]
MNDFKLYRKRIIPKECIELKEDIILFHDSELLITKWKTLNPRTDFDHGFSIYFLKRGYKISKFYTKANTLLYWYCDIISYEYINESTTTSLIVKDLLADVIIYPNNTVKVVDLEELSIAFANHDLTADELSDAISKLGALLKIINSDQFYTLTTLLESYDPS